MAVRADTVPHTVVISQPMYFPWPGFVSQVGLADTLVWLDDVRFSKGSFTNRVQVKLGEERVWMTVPLVRHSNRIMKDLAARDPEWSASHRALLSQSLKDYPYSARALALFDRALTRTSLHDVLIASTEVLLNELRSTPTRILHSSDLDIGGRGSQRVIELVKRVAPQGVEIVYLSGHGGAAYLNHEAFEDATIEVRYMDYTMKPWPQAGTTFTPYVTALDLVAATDDVHRHLSRASFSWRDFIARSRIS